jgi:hypothetical protein
MDDVGGGTLVTARNTGAGICNRNTNHLPDFAGRVVARAPDDLTWSLKIFEMLPYFTPPPGFISAHPVDSFSSHRRFRFTSVITVDSLNVHT